jgi:hypothetical protein
MVRANRFRVVTHVAAHIQGIPGRCAGAALARKYSMPEILEQVKLVEYLLVVNDPLQSNLTFLTCANDYKLNALILE